MGDKKGKKKDQRTPVQKDLNILPKKNKSGAKKKRSREATVFVEAYEATTRKIQEAKYDRIAQAAAAEARRDEAARSLEEKDDDSDDTSEDDDAESHDTSSEEDAESNGSAVRRAMKRFHEKELTEAKRQKEILEHGLPLPPAVPGLAPVSGVAAMPSAPAARKVKKRTDETATEKKEKKHTKNKKERASTRSAERAIVEPRVEPASELGKPMDDEELRSKKKRQQRKKLATASDLAEDTPDEGRRKPKGKRAPASVAASGAGSSTGVPHRSVGSSTDVPHHIQAPPTDNADRKKKIRKSIEETRIKRKAKLQGRCDEVRADLDADMEKDLLPRSNM